MHFGNKNAQSNAQAKSGKKLSYQPHDYHYMSAYKLQSDIAVIATNQEPVSLSTEKKMSVVTLRFLVFLTFIFSAFSIDLDPTDRQSILNATSILARKVQELYNGNTSAGVLGKWPYPPYYWWESGGAWGGMMQYWAYTRDDSYTDVMMNALLSQLGSNNDFILPQESFDTGNDDQAFWVFVAMSAAEYGYPAPPAPAPSWLQIVENAFNDYVSRWIDTGEAKCGGGLKWQIYPSNAGYFYKNAISNGAFFQISARLARFTGNQTYVDWAHKTWDWSEEIGLISPTYDVYDGTDETINCTQLDHHQWTYNVGVFLYGSAMMANYTNNTQIWVDRATGLLAATATFFTPFPNATDIMFEASCELSMTCNVDQQSMKAYLARWLAASSVVAPYLSGRVGSLLRASASGAARSCNGGPYGNNCGSKWYIDGYDGLTGLGEQLSALEVVTGLLANGSTPPMYQSQVTIANPPPTELPTTIQVTANPSQTADPLHDPPTGNRGSKRATVAYGSVLAGLVHLFV